MDASPLASDQGDPVHVLSASRDASGLDKIQAWSRDRTCLYTLPHFTTARCSALLERFFVSRSLEGTPSYLEASNPPDLAILHDMAHEGWVDHCDEGWQLAKAGIKQLAVAQCLDRPQSFCDVPSDMAVEDMTSWQLLRRLESLDGPGEGSQRRLNHMHLESDWCGALAGLLFEESICCVWPTLWKFCNLMNWEKRLFCIMESRCRITTQCLVETLPALLQFWKAVCLGLLTTMPAGQAQ